MGTPVDLAGDGRCDSPGFSAKYCTHVVFAAQLGRILHVSMWKSLLNHVCNKHDGHEGPFTECLRRSQRVGYWKLT